MNLISNTSSILIACLCCFCLTVSAQKIIPVDTTHVQTLRIDPSNAMGGKVADFFTEVEYILLESTKESLFGSISRLEVTNDRYLIFEKEHHYVLIFDKKGKFIKKIGSAKREITQFILNRWTKQIIICDEKAKNFYHYDLDGSFITSVSTDHVTNKYKTSEQFYFLTPNKGFANSYPYLQTDTTNAYYKSFQGAFITFANDDHTVTAKGMPFPRMQAGLTILSPGRFLTPSIADSVYYYTKPYEYDVYAISPGSIKMNYRFIFPLEMSLPAGFVNDTTLRNTRRWEWLVDHNDKIINVSNFYRINDMLLFMAGGLTLLNDEDLLMFSLKSGSLIGYKHIAEDITNAFLPIYDARNAFSLGVIAFGDNIYTSISSLQMFKTYQENREKNIVYPPHLQKFFTTRSKMDNPVMVRLKLKDDL